MSDPMRIRARVRGDKVDVKALIAHQMETGYRKNPDGTVIPAWYINEVKVMCNDKVVLHSFWGPSVAKNPFLSMSFSGGKAGDTISISWKDNHGDSRTDSVQVS